jgi:hypothetical protein
MSVLNFIWDLDQQEKIETQQDRIKLLEQNVARLIQWVNYLNNKVIELEKQNATNQSNDHR